MQRTRGGLGNALIIALISIGLILGALSISFVNFESQAEPTLFFPSPTAVVPTDTAPPTQTSVPTETPTPPAGITATPTVTQTRNPIPLNTAAGCTPGAAGWSRSYTVQPGDNLFRIALNHYTTLELMRKVNCRTSDLIVSGEVLWVPIISATRTATATLAPVITATAHPTDPLTETALPFTATYVPTYDPGAGATSLTDLP